MSEHFVERSAWDRLLAKHDEVEHELEGALWRLQQAEESLEQIRTERDRLRAVAREVVAKRDADRYSELEWHAALDRLKIALSGE